jgi:chitinase
MDAYCLAINPTGGVLMMRQFKKYFKLFLSAGYFLLVAFPMVVSAAQATLQWDPNGVTPDGYNLYQCLDGQSYDYSNPVNTSAITGTTYTVRELIEGQTYRFVVRAFVGDDESGDSNEAIYTVPVSDPDSDNDGHRDSVDAFPYDATEWRDTDSDGVGNQSDLDDDGDGLPDAWEILYDLDPLDSTDANGDLDGDGISNLDEHNNGTNPWLIPGNSPPNQPILIAPADGADGVDLMPTLMTGVYTDDDAHDHSRTLYQIATSTNWDSDLVFECEFTNQLTRMIVGDLILDPETTYFWRVRFYDAHNGRSEWSAASSFTTIDNVTAGFCDDDGDGILNDQEVAEGDIDPKLGDTSDMVVVGTSDETNPQLSVLLSSDADIISIRSTDCDSVEVGSGANRPDILTGVISFKVVLLNGATSADVTVNLLTPAPEDAVWYKYHVENGWAPYADATFSNDRKSVTIHLVDGGPGDDDGVQNGVIVDPSGLGYSADDPSSSLDNGSTSSNASSGCFIAVPVGEMSIRSYRGQFMMVIVIFMGIAAMVKRVCRR